MAGQIMLINPRRRRKHKKVRATSRRRKRRVLKARKTRRHRRHSITVRSNPIFKRRRRSGRRSGGSSNPLSNPMGYVKNTIIPAGIGAAGALGLDVLLGVLPIPVALQSPTLRPVLRIAGAIGLGYLASMVAGKSIGEQVTAGAITVTLYDVLKGVVQQAVPSIPLSGYDYDLGYMSPALQAGDSLSEYVSGMDLNEYVNGMGEYVS